MFKTLGDKAMNCKGFVLVFKLLYEHWSDRHTCFSEKQMNKLITFGIGFYSGVYAAQNYEIQRVDDPSTLWSKLLKYLDEAGKKG